MNEEQDLKLTDLDYLIGDHRLQMMKAALPYMNVSGQRLLSLYVKFNELRRTASLFEDQETATMGICSLGDKPSTPLDMLNAIKPYGSTYEQDTIDLVANFMQGFRISNAYRESADPADQEPHSSPGGILGHLPMEQLKNFLTPAQQSQFETMQLLMSVMQMT